MAASKIQSAYKHKKNRSEGKKLLEELKEERRIEELRKQEELIK